MNRSPNAVPSARDTRFDAADSPRSSVDNIRSARGFCSPQARASLSRSEAINTIKFLPLCNEARIHNRAHGAKVWKWCYLEYKHISSIVGKEHLWFTNVKNGAEKLKKLGKVFRQSVAGMKLENPVIIDAEANKTLAPKEAKKVQPHNSWRNTWGLSATRKDNGFTH